MENGKGKYHLSSGPFFPSPSTGREAVATPRAAPCLGKPRMRALSSQLLHSTFDSCWAPRAGTQSRFHTAAPARDPWIFPALPGTHWIPVLLGSGRRCPSLRCRQPENSQGSSGSRTLHTALQADMNLLQPLHQHLIQLPIILSGIQLLCKKTQIQLTQ